VRSAIVAGTVVRSADAATLVRIARRLRPLQRGESWDELLAVANAIVMMLVRKSPQARTLTYEAPGESTVCLSLSETVATMYVHGCTYLIESEAAWTIMAPRGVWTYPPHPVITLLCAPNGPADDAPGH
jgi:hypothetical protein